jgi:2-polyprenyl-3-methyl-5-hydroxy-6-metoxy-1,4-benzoquinol methylase
LSKVSPKSMRTGFPRLLSPEMLDTLLEDDPRAIDSRRDLRRINRIMGAAGILMHALISTPIAPKRIIELGAGDGSLMLRLAKRLSLQWTDVHVVLLDRKNVVDRQTLNDFARIGWSVEIVQADVDAWAASGEAQQFDIAIANLFIHHFDVRDVARLFCALSACTAMFVACEPRRARLPLLASHLLGLIGANEVTRKDAVLSVQAGFCETELSALWPSPAPDWTLIERRAGLFSHLFIARRQTR